MQKVHKEQGAFCRVWSRASNCAARESLCAFGTILKGLEGFFDGFYKYEMEEVGPPSSGVCSKGPKSDPTLISLKLLTWPMPMKRGGLLCQILEVGKPKKI